MIILLFDREEISDLQHFVQNMPTVAVSLKFLAMSASWENKRVAKRPVELATLAYARRVNCLDPRRDLSVYWVTADAGSRPGRDGSRRFIWDFAIRRELEDRPGWLAKAINPFPHRSREYAGGGHRWDLVLELTKGQRFKFSRLLFNWQDEEEHNMEQMEQELLEVDHITEGRDKKPPRDYRMANLRAIDGPTHREEQPARGKKRPAAASTTLRRRPASF